MTSEALRQLIQHADPDDLEVWRDILQERQRLIEACKDAAEAEALYELGEMMEVRLRIARAKLNAQCAECYQTGFLLRALTSDFARPTNGAALNVQA